jgi:diamine N-acetyltransferase
MYYKGTMTTIDLREITRDNLRICIELDVSPEQRAYVAPNVQSVAEAYVLPEADPRLIYADDEPVGFVLFHPREDGPEHYIVRFMIDHRFQGQGLGRRALAAAVEWVAREKTADRVRLSVVSENKAARELYLSAGFVETGEIDRGEVVMEGPVTLSRPGEVDQA